MLWRKLEILTFSCWKATRKCGILKNKNLIRLKWNWRSPIGSIIHIRVFVTIRKVLKILLFIKKKKKIKRDTSNEESEILTPRGKADNKNREYYSRIAIRKQEQEKSEGNKEDIHLMCRICWFARPIASRFTC